MYQVATITSKRQLTIPVDMYRRLGFEKGQKVIISIDADGIRIDPAVDVVERLAGSLPLPLGYRGKDLKTLMVDAKRAYLRARAKHFSL